MRISMNKITAGTQVQALSKIKEVKPGAKAAWRLLEGERA
jgi:hypothetical protein